MNMDANTNQADLPEEKPDSIAATPDPEPGNETANTSSKDTATDAAEKNSELDSENVVKVEVVENDEDDDELDEAAEVSQEVVTPEPEPKPELPAVNYLDPGILSPKTIELDELEKYSEEEDLADIDEKIQDLYENSFSDIQEGEVVTGSIVNISDRDVFIDIGFKSEGIVPRHEFSDTPEIGDEVEVFISSFENSAGQFVLSKEKADFAKRWNELRNCFESDEVVQGKIVRRIKGGMVVNLEGVFAFLPGSQIDVRPVTDFNEHVGAEYDFKIVKFNELRKNIVLSRKVLLESDLREKRQEIISQLEVGMVLEGTVKNITDFGAFIDLGGIDGLLHLTDITWGRINHPSEMLKIDENVTVKVIDFDIEKAHVSLGMKQLVPEPWEDAENKYPVESEVTGSVVNMMKYGVFVELEKGIEGLIHVSEMSWTRHIKHPSELFKLGDVIKAKVLSVDPKEKKISLGIKQLSANPWDEIETKYPIDSIHTGVVRNLTQFGAFVELEEGIDGLVHVSDMSWTKNIRHPKDVLKRGQEVQVKILDVSSENRRLSLGIKQVESDPWPNLKSIYTAGTVVKGEVIRALDKGIIFQLDHDLEGIVPLKRVPKHDRKMIKTRFKPGSEHEVVVQEVDQEYKKVILMVEWEGSTDMDGEVVREKKKKAIRNEPTSDKLEIPQDIIDSIAQSEREEEASSTASESEPKSEPEKDAE